MLSDAIVRFDAEAKRLRFTDVLRARQMFDTGNYTRAEICRECNMSLPTWRKIERGAYDYVR